MNTDMQKRISNKVTYGPLSQKTLHSALKRELLTNFGFENMALVADLLIDRFLTIINEFTISPGRLQPYQTMLIGVDKREKFGYGKNILNAKLKAAIVTIITPEEILELVDGMSLKELKPCMVARIFKEAFEQGAVLPFSTVGLLFGNSVGAISKWINQYKEEHPDEVVPHAGVIFDLGPTQTHKEQVLFYHYQGLLTQEIARRTNHDPHRVDKYLKDHYRIVTAHEAGHSHEEICLLTSLSSKLVQQHLDIYQRLAKKETKHKDND